MFNVFNNIIFISADLVQTYLPQLINYLNRYHISHIDRYLFVLHVDDPKTIITLEILNSLVYTGFALIYNDIIEILQSNDTYIKLQLLDNIIKYYHKYYDNDNIYVQFPVTQARFDIDVLFYVKYGFENPELIKDRFLRLQFKGKRSKEHVLEKIFHLVKHKRDSYEITICISETLADMLGKYVNLYETEVGGVFNIQKYNNDGVAILELYQNDIVIGSDKEFAVHVPARPGAFSFHTHPDSAYTKFDTILGWPSGTDMAIFVYWFLENKNQYAHFVTSSEGIWTICITVEFQKLLLSIKEKKAQQCGLDIVTSLKQVFENKEKLRSKKNDTSNRLLELEKFLFYCKNFTIGHLIIDTPNINEHCKDLIVDSNALLYNVALIKWKYFKTKKYINLSFSYILDELGGFTGFNDSMIF